MTAAEAGSALLAGVFGGLLIETGWLIGKRISTRAKDLRADDGIDARNYGVNRLPKGWSSNDYNVSGQRGTLVIDELGRRRITVDHNTGITNYYGTAGNVVASKEFKKPISGSGKEKASNIPSWVAGERPYIGENGNDFAKRLLDEKYGK
ncbi:hypothetical protein ACWOC1_02165 [Enterococcus quebecensis]|uniref:Uncharacterized protein n=1 Tax=Enterococcus quebecensis TaxID=903983 RepID=A0A1E5H3I6_9ENTE|nr:hypothetical protein [Enterococcus quebecensis]OEG19375.1 hypothetical protein BCR23_01425 [Enterococcus quebecensis]OJG75702.1 hypothetical protein RV12_GL000041 [Enterococcus quebecensis]